MEQDGHDFKKPKDSRQDELKEFNNEKQYNRIVKKNEDKDNFESKKDKMTYYVQRSSHKNYQWIFQ